MTETIIAAGTLLASADDRVVSGLLIPYGEDCSSNKGRFKVDAESFDLPEERPSGIFPFNDAHDLSAPLGPAISTRSTPAGLFASFHVLPGQIGDTALADIQSGKRKHLSVEVTGIKIKAGKAIAGTIIGAALVEKPAFPSATLLAAAADTEATEPTDPQVTVEKHVTTVTDSDGNEEKQTTTTTTKVEADGTTTVTTVVVTEPADMPAQTQEEPVGNATVSPTLTAHAVTSAKKTETQGPAMGDVFDLITKAKAGDRSELLLAALSDIKISGVGALPAAGVLQPSWLGELWAGRTYQRKYMPLIRNGKIAAIDEKGFVFADGILDLVQPWAGNKTQLPTGTATTSVLSAVLQKWGFAADIAREFFDLPGGAEVIDAFMRRLAESYAKQTDLWTLDQIAAAAAANLIAPDVYPAEYPAALGQLIQGIEAIEDANDTPTFAIANKMAWDEMKYTPFESVPEYIKFDVSLAGTTGTADGRVHVVRGDIGIDDTAAVIVGSAAAAHVNEVAGPSPINVDALDIANGGVDKAIIGYTQYLTDYADGLVLIGTADVVV